MKTYHLLLVAIFLILASCQKTTYGPARNPDNGVLHILFEHQSTESKITLVPALEEEKRNTIEISLVPGTDFTQVSLAALELSPGATSSLQVGDVLDLRKEQSFTVTAENGMERHYVILPPEKFNVRKQGPQIALIVDGQEQTKSLGEWLCLGQNRTADIDAQTGDTIGFFRCATTFAPFVSVNKGPNVLAKFEGDRDDYFIFNSNGTYEFSYGKDGESSSLTGDENFREYLLPAGKGYWSVGEGQNFLVANREPRDRGLYLTDAETGAVHFFGFVNIAAVGVNIQGWPLNNSSLRISYKFDNSDEDWSTWVVD